jgi:ubiquinone/menaquinone biosynthesis C-methylase UbiE
MLRRARNRLKSAVPSHVAADMCHLPFADNSFDCITCGYVLEHLPEARPGLAEIARVLRPGGRLMLLTTEDNFSGAWTSRFWYCRTYNRRELRHTCENLGLAWKKEIWFTRMHKLFKAGGICVEIQKA